MKTIKATIEIIAAVAILCAFIYGCYWIGKRVSYGLFYQDMVEGTVAEMVLDECLREK
jgi:hypothetical protein